MSKLASKLNKRIMAAVLSVAMVMSNMTVYASEVTSSQVENTVDEAVVDAEDTSVTLDDATTSDESSETDAVVDDANGETIDTPDDETAGDVTDDDVQTPDTGEEGSTDTDEVDEVVADEDTLDSEEEVKNEEELVAEAPSKAEAEEGVKTIDISNGLKKGQTYGDSEILKLEVLEDMGATAITDGKTIDGETYYASIQGSGNPSPNKGAVPTSGAVFKITALKYASIKFVTGSAAKTYYFIDGTDADSPVKVKEGTAIPEGTLSFSMEMGKTYYFYADGSKVKAYAISYQEEEAAPEPKDIDISSGLVAKDGENVKYYGDPELLQLSVLEDMETKALEGGAKEVDGVAYDKAMQGSGNPKTSDNKNPSGKIPATGAVFIIKAVKNVTMSFVTASAAKTYYLVDGTDADAPKTIKTDTAIPEGTLKFNLKAGKTYYFYADGSKVKVYAISYVENLTKDWEEVDAPTLAAPTLSTDKKQINVSVNAVVGSQGGDSVSVIMYKNDVNDEDAVTLTSTDVKSEHTLSFTPEASGTYKFKAILSREDETDKESSEVTYTNFALPLAAPTITSIENKGKVTGSDPESGSVEIKWDKVPEATGYKVSVKQGDNDIAIDGTNTSKTLDGETTTVTINQNLTINTVYTFCVAALRTIDGASAPETSIEATRSLGITATEGGKYITEGTYVLDVATDLEIMATQGSKDGKSEVVGTDDYFTVHYGAASQVEAHSPGAFTDGYTPSKRLNFRNTDKAFTTSSDSIEFETTALTRVKIWWRCAGDDRQMAIIDSTGKQVAITNENSANNTSYISTLMLDEGGTYYLGGAPFSNYIYKVEVINGYEAPAKTEWADMAKPEIKNVAFKADSNTVLEVTVAADVSETGADKVTVSMIDKDDDTKTYTASSEVPKAEHTVEITPSASGQYKFVATLSRKDDETTLDGDAYPAGEDYYTFTLPLGVPLIKGITNKGAVDADKKFGSVELSWNSVSEATSYIVKAVDKAAADGADPAYAEELTASFVTINTGLEIGHTYIFSVAAKRTDTGVDGADEITATDTQEFEIKDENKRSWFFSAYGDSTNTRSNGYTDADNVGDENKTILEGSGDVRVWSEGGAGKIVPASVDGIAFYYTTVDPNVKNFTLSAIAHVNSWDISNGQDGFGLMASDRVGTHGDSGKWWNNSYQALASKIEYRWDPNLNAADYSSNTDYTKYSMKLGIGTTEKKGVTKENLPLLNNTDTVVDATKRYFKSTTKTLETYCGRNGLAGGTWNVIGNYTQGNTPEGTVSDSALVTDLLFSIELNNTGYYLSYTPITVEKNEDGSIKRDENGKAVYETTGEPVTNKHYDRDALSKLEEDSVYVGFFASRNADVTFMNIELDDSEAYDPNGTVEQQPIEKIDPSYGFTSGTTANESSYDLLFAANWQGHVTVKDGAGNVLVGWDTTTPQGEEESDEDYIIRTGRVLDEVDSQTGEYLMTYEPIKYPVELGLGTTTFTYTFVPDSIDDYNPDPNADYDAETNGSVPKGFTMLSDYSAQSGIITVTYKTYGESGNALYVSPTGTALGNGTQKNPLDIYTAVKYVQAGQTIYLMEGTYNLTKTVTIDRGINGTEQDRIYMLPADPSTRPKFDFNKQCEGIVLAGNYWYLKGFDVTGSANAKDGMRISGSHNVIEQVNAYMNGNTGIQISRYSGSDTWDYWPSYNLVLNCTSYLNADQGFEDADGFTAKLTIAEGNVFDGCIAAYNADDGWDLFAKVESGNIGRVIIKNCIAYKNGYVLVKDTDDPDSIGTITQAEARATDRVFSLTDGIETEAGNGNGFKLGGSNLPDKNGASEITGWDAGHTVENCLAFYNKAKGIDSNSCPNIKAKNSISYNNEGANIAFYGTASNTDFASDGLISYRTESEIKGMLDTHDNIQPLGTQLNNDGATGMSAFFNDKSYYWYPGEDGTGSGSFQIDAAATAKKVADEGWTDARPEKDHVVWKNSASDTKVADNWFVKVGEAEFKLFDQGFRNDPSSIRNADNTINTNGFLMLTENALVGGSLGGADHEEQGKLPEIPDNVTETDGSISKGDAADETSGGVAPEDMDKFIELNGTIKDAEDIIGLWFNVVEPAYYTGKAVKPLVHVYNGTTQLTKKDYSITYKNNVNAYVEDTTAEDYDASYAQLKSSKKVPTIIVKGKGNYVGMVEATFDIHPVSLSNDDTLNSVSADDTLNSVGASDITLASTGKALNVKPVVTFGNRKLSNARNKDYEIDGIYQINEDTEPTLVTSVTAKGTYEIRITGHGNFTGTRNIGLRVYDKNDIDNAYLVSKFKVAKIADQYREVTSTSNYTGAITAAVPKTPELTVTNSSGTTVKAVEDDGKINYTVTYKNNVEIGTATAIITGVGDYYGTKEVKFRIIAPMINQLERQKELTIVDTSKSANETTGMYPEFVNRTEYAFEGKAIEPSIAVQLKDGTLLNKDEDYTLSFRNNNRAGTASVVIKGKGNYSGSISKTFKITVFDIADAKNRQYIGGTFKFATVESDDGNSDYAATLNVAAEKGVNKPEVTLTINGVTMKKGRDYTVTYKNNTYAAQQKGRKPQVIIKGRGALTGMLTKDFTITKKNLNQVTVTAQDVKISSRKDDAVSGNIAARIVLQDLNGKNLSAGADYDKNIEYILLDDYGNESGTKTSKAEITDNKKITINKYTNVVTVRAIIKAANTANASYTGQTTVDFQVGYAKQSLNSAKYEIDYMNGRFKYFNYTGDNIVITDNLKVYFDKNKPLTVNVDYEILPATYKNNNKKGTASVVIRGKGSYSGTKVITFKIGAQNITDIGWWTAK